MLRKLTSGSQDEKKLEDKVKPVKGSAGVIGIPHFVRNVTLIFTPREVLMILKAICLIKKNLKA